jgi:hypothetical protein
MMLATKRPDGKFSLTHRAMVRTRILAQGSEATELGVPVAAIID